MLQSVGKSIGSMVEHWHKYTAFNVRPLSAYGTIEFRHLQATEDTATFSLWLNMIYNLYTFNKENTVDVLIPDSMLYRLVNTIASTPYSREALYEKLQETILNDLLLTINPSSALINARLKQAKAEA